MIGPNVWLKNAWCFAGLFVICCTGGTLLAQDPLANTIDEIPTSYTGLVFQLSKDYPSTLPADPQKPWKAFDFKTQPAEYMQSVLAYALDGNIEADWVVQDNAVRKWYHAPGLLNEDFGREFVRGLTRERTSRPRELHEEQSSWAQNWGVGMYNPVGGFTLGEVWKDPANPDPTEALFADGAVAIKLLFTRALIQQVPYLTRTLRWRANVNRNGSPIQVKLIQIDIAVKDDRSDQTGWVFGTFIYQGTAPGETPFDRMVPVGLMWGNDPALTQEAFDAGDRPTETWLNPAILGPPRKLPHFGWLDRMNGPVDNPSSACLACHMTAQVPTVRPMVPAVGMTSEERMSYFRNLAPGVPFEAGMQSLDYSLQLTVGIREFPGSAAPPPAALVAGEPLAFNLREGSFELTAEVKDVPAGEDDDIEVGAETEGTSTYSTPWIPIGIGLLVVVAILLAVARSKAQSA